MTTEPSDTKIESVAAHHEAGGGVVPRGSHRARTLLDPERPDHIDVPLDRAHEFLIEGLREGDPDVELWERWFELTGTTYARVVRLSGTIMLYTHRMTWVDTTREHRKWCCA